MKKYINIFALMLAAAASVGCHKENVPDDDVNVTLDPNKKYIHFDADIQTRAALVEGNILQDDFMVLGYQYPGLWEAESVLATPNVFDKNPQLVSYENGVFTYGTPKVWTANRYSFFGYYPSDNTQIQFFEGKGILTGSPYIWYSLPTDNDPTKLIDVMTASYIDTGVASSASVPLQFHHRLSAIDVGARNYYEHDHDNNSATVKKLVTIEITNLQVNLQNIVNTKAKIYLDHTIPTEYPENQPKAGQIYPMVGNSPWAVDIFDVKPNTKEDRDIRLVSTQEGENASSMILIPQEELVSGNVQLTYKKKYQDDNGNWVYLHEGDNLQDFEFTPTDLNLNFNKALIEGRRYFIELTFTSDAVSVNVIAADEWDDKDDIRHEFE